MSKLPIVGIFSDSPSYDRFIIQAYMNLVTMSVIFLLWANNPPETVMRNNGGTDKAVQNGDIGVKDKKSIPAESSNSTGAQKKDN